LPNPGREAEFRQLTGRDAQVVEYLRRQPGVDEFLAAAFSLVDASVANYRQRGFSNLMVSFGCTGGQHRSVYLAERLAEHLRGQKDLTVELRHIQLERLGLEKLVRENASK
jgi:RNase adaptor protein for sRNA GlmZ degradation